MRWDYHILFSTFTCFICELPLVCAFINWKINLVHFCACYYLLHPFYIGGFLVLSNVMIVIGCDFSKSNITLFALHSNVLTKLRKLHWLVWFTKYSSRDVVILIFVSKLIFNFSIGKVTFPPLIGIMFYVNRKVFPKMRVRFPRLLGTFQFTKHEDQIPTY